MNKKYKEIIKLKQMLRNNNIPFFEEPLEDGLCLTVNDNLNCVQYSGSYGSNNDLLEIAGGLTESEYKHDSVLGHLTAKEVLKRFKFCYRNKVPFYYPEEEDTQNKKLELVITTTFSYDNKATQQIIESLSQSCVSFDTLMRERIAEYLKEIYGSYQPIKGEQLSHNISYSIKE